MKVDFIAGTFENATMEIVFRTRGPADLFTLTAKNPEGFDFTNCKVESVGLPLPPSQSLSQIFGSSIRRALSGESPAALRSSAELQTPPGEEDHAVPSALLREERSVDAELVLDHAQLPDDGMPSSLPPGSLRSLYKHNSQGDEVVGESMSSPLGPPRMLYEDDGEDHPELPSTSSLDLQEQFETCPAAEAEFAQEAEICAGGICVGEFLASCAAERRSLKPAAVTEGGFENVFQESLLALDIHGRRKREAEAEVEVNRGAVLVDNKDPEFERRALEHVGSKGSSAVGGGGGDATFAGMNDFQTVQRRGGLDLEVSTTLDSLTCIMQTQHLSAIGPTVHNTFDGAPGAVVQCVYSSCRSNEVLTRHHQTSRVVAYFPGAPTSSCPTWSEASPSAATNSLTSLSAAITSDADISTYSELPRALSAEAEAENVVHDSHFSVSRKPRWPKLRRSLQLNPADQIYTKIPVSIIRQVGNQLQLVVDAPAGTAIKLLLYEVRLPNVGGETYFDMSTYFRGELQDQSLNCCHPADGDPNMPATSFYAVTK